MDVTAKLAVFAADLTYDSIPEDVRERSRIFVFDGISVMLAAAAFYRDNDDRMLADYLETAAPADGTATVVGYGMRTSPMMAAFANGTLSEVLDFQDSNLGKLTHNGTPIIPATLATAEHTGAPWREIAAAVVAAYEVHNRLLAAVQPSHWYGGFQSTGTFGTSGASISAGKLLGLDGAGLTAGLGITGFVMPVSNGDNEFKGHNAKPIHGGQAAMVGVSSAFMAKVGFEAGPLEGEPPRYHAALHILTDGPPKLEESLDGLGEVWHCRDVAFKPYPMGHLIIGPVEVVIDILKERPIDWREVEGIDIASYRAAVHATGKKYTTPEGNFVDAHFSIPYCVAATLMDGEFTPRQIHNERLLEPNVHELASRVIVKEDLEMSAMFPDKWPVEVNIRLKGGEVVTKRIDEVKWSPTRPPNFDELAEKFHAEADRFIGKEAADRAVDLISGLKVEDTLKDVMDLVRG